jgi:hypothetical protein
MTTKYQVRKNADPSKPEDRGVLVAEYETYKEAFRHWQRLNAKNEGLVFVSKVEEK